MLRIYFKASMDKGSAARRLSRIVPLLLAVLAPCAGANVQVCEPEPIAKRKALVGVETDTPLFFFDSAGRFYRDSFRGGKRDLVSDHRFVGVPYVRSSPDHRWMIYSGLLKSGGTIQFWLYDKRQGTDRLVLEKPDGGWADPMYSPDGRSIAVFASHGSGWRGAKGVGLYLVDLATAQTTYLGNPSAVAVPNGDALAYWSRDGGDVLVYVRASPVTSKVTEYYRLPLATRVFERISGSYSGMGPPAFFSGTTRIPVYSELGPPRSNAEIGVYRSPDGAQIASQTELQSITVTGRDGKRRKFRTIRQDDCGMLDMVGWVNSRYFVYRSHANTFLGDAKSGLSGFLFYDMPEPGYFEW